MNPTLPVTRLLAFALAIAGTGLPSDAAGQQSDLPPYLRDRGHGLPSSMFGTFIQRGQVLLYPFFEYYHDNDYEYKPAELGYGLDVDYRGKYRASEGLLFVGYGLTDWLAIEFEAAVITATLEKSPNDTSQAPAKIEESGLGDVEGQLRARVLTETAGRPELFGLLEVVFPTQPDKLLIGTPDWEFKLGVGATKGFSWGTVTLRTEAEYEREESKVVFGEYAVEYLKRLSPSWRVYLGVEGVEDEVELITEVQWHISDYVFLKLNNAFGITSKATDWAPEVGVMFAFRRPHYGR